MSEPSEPRVVVTGVGAVSALGPDAGEHLRGLFAGKSGVAPAGDTERRSLWAPLEARARGFDRRSAIANRMLRKLLTPSGAYAVAAAGEALRSAGFATAEPALAACGLYVGSVCIDIEPEIFIPALRESIGADGKIDVSRFATRGMLLIDPLFLVKSLPNGGLGGIAIEHQVTGPNLNLTNGPVSGLQAVASALRALRRGEAELALAGGYDSLLGMDSVAEHLLAGRVATAGDPPAVACKPFDLERSGYVLGEGAAFLMLETQEHAERRGARVWAELVGAGQTTSPSAAAAEGLARAATTALGGRNGRVALFGDGTAVESDDLAEAEASARLFGERAVPYTAATPAIGFTGSASGAFSLLHACAAVRDGVLPPMLNCSRPDPRCPLDLVHEARRTEVTRALVWNSDRGIKHAAVVVAPWRS